MAPGLLVHWRAGTHGMELPPQGAAAQVLRGLDAQQPAPQLAPAVAVLVAAFDPCVDYVLAPAYRAEEVSCA
jgi:hypothetical protein